MQTRYCGVRGGKASLQTPLLAAIPKVLRWGREGCLLRAARAKLSQQHPEQSFHLPAEPPLGFGPQEPPGMLACFLPAPFPAGVLRFQALNKRLTRKAVLQRSRRNLKLESRVGKGT